MRGFAFIFLALLSGCTGCDPFGPRDGLPHVPWFELPSDVRALRRIADEAYFRTRRVPDVVRAHSALKKADNIEENDFETTWRIARIAGVLARIDTVHAGQWADEAKRAGAVAKTMRPKRVEGHLYYAIALGMYVRHHTTEASALLNELIAELGLATQCNKRYNHGESRRVLGATYIYAPAWPTGVGDLEEALAVLKALVTEYPDEPMNLFFLAEAYRKAQQPTDAIRVYRRVLTFPPKGLWRVEGPTYRAQARQALIELSRGH